MVRTYCMYSGLHNKMDTCGHVNWRSWTLWVQVPMAQVCGMDVTGLALTWGSYGQGRPGQDCLDGRSIVYRHDEAQ